MGETLAVPVWLALLAALLAAWAAYDKLIVPCLRWMLARPANQVIDELSTRLRIGIRPFQRTRRQALIHRLTTDPKVLQTAERYAAANRLPLPKAMQRVERYAREIVPAFNAYLYFRIGYWAGRKLAQSLYRVRLGYVDTAGIAAIDPDATVVFVMNHRSNMDYVLAAYLAAEQTTLSYAVGEWARLWPLSALIRADGRLFRAPQLGRRALPARARALHRDGDRGGRAAGGVPGGRPVARRPHARAAAGRARLHAARLSPRRRARPGVRAARHQLRPRARGSLPDGIPRG